MVSPGNQRCANCIGTFSFAMVHPGRSLGSRFEPDTAKHAG